MQMSQELINRITDSINNAFAYCRVVTDSEGEPEDLIILDVNRHFEEITFLKKEDITGKRATVLFPGVRQSDFDWIGEMGRLALHGGELNFKQYFEPALSRYYFKAFSHERGYVAVLFREVKIDRALWDKQAEADILSILAESRELPWALQMVLLKTLEITGFPAGAIRLLNGDDYFYREHQGLSGDFLKGAIKSIDNDGFFLHDETGEKPLKCLLEHIVRVDPATGWVRKTNLGSLFTNNAGKLFEDNQNLINNANDYCCKCIGEKPGSYQTIVMVPLKALEETIGVFYLLHDSPEYMDFNRVSYIESLLMPIGYTVKHLQDQDYIQESERRFRLLVQNARDIIFRFFLSPELACDYISPVVENITGYRRGDFYRDPYTFIRIAHEEDRHLASKLFNPHNNKRGNSTYETVTMRWVCRNEQTVWVELQVSTYEDENKHVTIEGIIRDVSERVETEKHLRASREMINTLSMQLLQAYEQERARLARELHDEVGQALTAVKLDLQMLGSAVHKEVPSLMDRLSRSIKIINDTIVNVRKQVVYLRPPVLDSFSLADLVKDMVKEMSIRGGFKPEVIISETFNGRMSQDIEIALYRCIQEAVTNVLRHARAGNVIVEMNRQNNSIFARIKDDGRGFDCNNVRYRLSGQVGLKGMRERVSLLGGELSIVSEQGKGTEVKISIPLNGNSEV